MAYMNHKNIPDLNLLRVFLAVWEARSLTAAGDRLHLTQPAVSHALRRLRALFGDPLFVRTVNGMVPTEAATRLHGPLDQAFALIGRTVQTLGGFDPETSERVFRVAMSDMSEFYVLPPLLVALEQRAPKIRLSTARVRTEMLSAAMRAGEIDLALGYLSGLRSECEAERLFSDEFICMVRAGHPLGKTKLTRRHLSALRYIDPGSDATGHQALKQWLADQGMEREIKLHVSHFTAAPEIVRSTDLAVFFPRRIAERYNRMNEFTLTPLPVPLPSIEVDVYVHNRFLGDPGITWLRSVIIEMFRSTMGMPEPV